MLEDEPYAWATDLRPGSEQVAEDRSIQQWSSSLLTPASFHKRGYAKHQENATVLGALPQGPSPASMHQGVQLGTEDGWIRYKHSVVQGAATLRSLVEELISL